MKKTLIFPFAIIIIFIVFTTSLFAQQIEVKGKVSNRKGEALNAKIYVKSSKKTITTNKDGTFTVMCPKKGKIKISAEYYSSKTVKIKSSGFLDIQLRKSGIDYSQYTNFKDIMLKLYKGAVEVNGDKFIVKFDDLRGITWETTKLLLDGNEVKPKILLELQTSSIKKVEVLNEHNDHVKYGSTVILVTIKKSN